MSNQTGKKENFRMSSAVEDFLADETIVKSVENGTHMSAISIEDNAHIYSGAYDGFDLEKK